MAQRLGEMLLHVGALTEAQLEEVLSAQSIYGGRLGTNLVEMGLLSEEELARLLNEKLGVPCVDTGTLERVPASLISLIPQEMAERFKVVPVALEGKRLTLAMADPANFSAIDEIGFYTGLVIVPQVCSELRLTLALERHYGLKSPLHFIPVPGGVRTKVISMTRQNAGLAPDPKTSLPGGAASGSDSDTGIAAPQPGGEAAPGTRPAPLTMDAVATRFADAKGEGEVVSALMCYLRDEFDRAGFMKLSRDAAVGVQAFSGGGALPSFVGSVLEIADAALLRRVLKERSSYLGKLPENGVEGQLLKKLGGQVGMPVLLQPIVIQGVSVAFLLVEDEGGRLAPGLFDLQRVVAKAELAFEMLGIRKKIGLV